MKNKTKTQLSNALYWMLELKSDWERNNEQESVDYQQLLEDINKTEKLVNNAK